MKRAKKVLDEREMLEVYKMEHIWFWILYWGLFISMQVKVFILSRSFTEVLSEFILLMIGSFGIIIGCIRKGNWGCSFEGTPKNILLLSTVVSAVFAIFWGITMYWNNPYFPQYPLHLVLICLALFFFLWLALAGSLFLCAHLINKKRKELDKSLDEEE